MFSSFSQVSSNFGPGSAGKGAEHSTAEHHEPGTYQVTHGKPYVPAPALNFPLFVGSLAIAPMLGLIVLLGHETESASILKMPGATHTRGQSTACKTCNRSRQNGSAAPVSLARVP